MAVSTGASGASGAEGASGASGATGASGPTEKEGALRWYAPPGHSGAAVLQVKAGEAWVDVPTVTALS